jgi:hypothetical protein
MADEENMVNSLFVLFLSRLFIHRPIMYPRIVYAFGRQSFERYELKTNMKNVLHFMAKSCDIIKNMWLKWFFKLIFVVKSC